VLILGTHGVAAAAAAGVLMTVTGTIGGLCFAAWAGADAVGSHSLRLRRARVLNTVEPATARATAGP
jgi:hypothetical protein